MKRKGLVIKVIVGVCIVGTLITRVSNASVLSESDDYSKPLNSFTKKKKTIINKILKYFF